MSIVIPVVLQLLLLCAPTLSQDRIQDRLVVWGDGFRFGVKEPDSWLGDTEHASQLSSNIIFYRKGDTITSPYGVIRIRVNKKIDENTAEDLKADIDDYKHKFADIQFDELAVSHPQYELFSKVFFIEGKFYEYVTYVNPGEKLSYNLSVSLSIDRRRATVNELSAYGVIVSSLVCGRK